MMEKTELTLYLGGTRSGKSARAEAQALRTGGPVLYVATAEARPARDTPTPMPPCTMGIGAHKFPIFSDFMLFIFKIRLHNHDEGTENRAV